MQLLSRFQKLSLIAFLAVVGCVLLYVFTRPDPIALLRERNVPTPEHAHVTNSNHGGLFAKYLFVRMKLKPEELKSYRDSLPSGVPLNSEGGIRVIASDSTDSELLETSQQETEIVWKQGFGDGYLSWWDIDLIESGTYHQQELDNDCGYEVFIDDDNSVVYVYWHYS